MPLHFNRKLKEEQSKSEWNMGRGNGMCTGCDFLFDVHFVDLENFQPLVRFKVQKFAGVTKFVFASSVTPLRPRQQQVSVSIV